MFAMHFNLIAVVYLDADTIVVKSIEDLFKCGKFCANLKHSERLNSGVMVVEPSQKVFNDMMSKVNTLESYTGGKVIRSLIFIVIATANIFLLGHAVLTQLRASVFSVYFSFRLLCVSCTVSQSL